MQSWSFHQCFLLSRLCVLKLARASLWFVTVPLLPSPSSAYLEVEDYIENYKEKPKNPNLLQMELLGVMVQWWLSSPTPGTARAPDWAHLSLSVFCAPAAARTKENPPLLHLVSETLPISAWKTGNGSRQLSVLPVRLVGLEKKPDFEWRYKPVPLSKCCNE